jgi:hypothetical protein
LLLTAVIVAMRTLFPNSWASWLSVKSSYTRPAACVWCGNP